jgi:hypothetical protein
LPTKRRCRSGASAAASISAAIRRALAESTDPLLYRVLGRELTRSQLLPANVEIMAAGKDLPPAMEGATELVEIAERPRDISHLPVDPCDTDIPQRARI